MTDEPTSAPANWADLVEEAIRDAEQSSMLLQEANRRIQSLERELAHARLEARQEATHQEGS